MAFPELYQLSASGETGIPPDPPTVAHSSVASWWFESHSRRSYGFRRFGIEPIVADDGSIHVEDNEPQGARFVIELSSADGFTDLST